MRRIALALPGAEDDDDLPSAVLQGQRPAVHQRLARARRDLDARAGRGARPADRRAPRRVLRDAALRGLGGGARAARRRGRGRARRAHRGLLGVPLRGRWSRRDCRGQSCRRRASRVNQPWSSRSTRNDSTKPGVSSWAFGAAGVESTFESGADRRILPLSIVPELRVVKTGEYGPYWTTWIPFGSAPVWTSRTARTRHCTVVARPAWRLQYSRSSATFVSVRK